jgi:hypothetical protein
MLLQERELKRQQAVILKEQVSFIVKLLALLSSLIETMMVCRRIELVYSVIYFLLFFILVFFLKFFFSFLFCYKHTPPSVYRQVITTRESVHALRWFFQML